MPLLLGRTRLLGDVEIAAAGRAAAPLVRREHRDAERKFGVGAHIRQVAVVVHIMATLRSKKSFGVVPTR